MPDEVLAIIPARGGSKRIPRKNIRPFLGVPMLARTVGILREAGVFTPNQTSYIWGVALKGTTLYASDMINGLWKLDVSAIHP